MQDERINDTGMDAVMTAKIHDNRLLGRMNDHNQYVLPAQVLEELIRAKKYLEKKVLDTIYLSCHLTRVEKDLTIMMNYQVTKDGMYVVVNWALLEEVYIADGMMTNQIISSICSNTYPYSDDVLFRAFADFNVYIKDQDSGEEKRLDSKDQMPFSEIIIQYNMAVDTLLKKKMKKLYNQTCAKQLQKLKQLGTPYSIAVLQEIDNGVQLYLSLQEAEGNIVDGIEDKVMLDIINNAVEKVDVTLTDANLGGQKEFLEYRNEVYADFRATTKQLEEDAQSKIVKATAKEDKAQMLSYLEVISEAEKNAPSETIDLGIYLSDKTTQELKNSQNNRGIRMYEQMLAGLGNIAEVDNKKGNIAEVSGKTARLDATASALMRGKGKSVEVEEMHPDERTISLEKTAPSQGAEVQTSGKKPAAKTSEVTSKPAKSTEKKAGKSGSVNTASNTTSSKKSTDNESAKPTASRTYGEIVEIVEASEKNTASSTGNKPQVASTTSTKRTDKPTSPSPQKQGEEKSASTTTQTQSSVVSQQQSSVEKEEDPMALLDEVLKTNEAEENTERENVEDLGLTEASELLQVTQMRERKKTEDFGLTEASELLQDMDDEQSEAETNREKESEAENILGI